jgi:spore germination protein
VGAAANVPATAVRLGPGFDTPGYLVTLHQRGRVRTSVGLALHAGQVLWMTSNESMAGPTRYTVSQGLSQADRFLQTHGYENVVLKSQIHYGNSGTYTYVPMTGFVARESRPILVKVNLGNGSVTGFDASSMIGANTPQISLQPTISAGQAQRSLSAGFTVRQSRLAILEPSGQQAILVYEFMGASGATAFEVCVNAHSGAVVSVDKLNKSELEKL